LCYELSEPSERVVILYEFVSRAGFLPVTCYHLHGSQIPEGEDFFYREMEILKTEFFGKSLSGPFTIPSGIVTTSVPLIEHVFRSIPQIGVVTTKSIGLQPRDGNREPIVSQYAPGCFVNAVGLTNPGADRSADLLSALEVPPDRFLLTSIFGGSVEEFVAVARKLAPHSDGLELNLSCPHAEGYGMDMGQDPALVKEITAAVKSAVGIPVIPKLTPNTANIGEIARAAAEGGADAICAINTVGPGYYSVHGHPVLSNRYGGLSGKGILPIGLKCVREIAEAADLPIIGCGGISSAEDVRAYRDAGASIFGVGSALTGLTSRQMKDYFRTLERDLADSSNFAEEWIRYDVDMSFRSYELRENERITDDLSILTFDGKIDIRAGEFVFVWIPGHGEKPFSVLRDDPFSLVVIDLGYFTNKLVQLQPGTEVFVRGPYGIAVTPPDEAKIMLVSGGTGLAAVYQIARDFGNSELFFGARSEDRLYFMDECRACSQVHISTDDGSRGYHGLVTEMLGERLTAMTSAETEELYFYNCGPESMVNAAVAVEREVCAGNRIFNSIDYVTKCGVGMCGSCYSPDGRRLCVDGPFLDVTD
jgi:dihydroorotate dehydrogenase subfamily 1